MDTVEIGGRLEDLQNEVGGQLEELRLELRELRTELAHQRRPVAWHVTDAGTSVLCSDGAVLWYDEDSGDWSEASPVPGTPAAAAGVTT